MLHAAALPQIQLGSRRHVRTAVFLSRNQQLEPLAVVSVFLVGFQPSTTDGSLDE